MPAPIPFDRIADRYDATRGAGTRGQLTAEALVPWLPDGPVVELAVGTGIVAEGLAAAGRAPVGIDLSLPMLAKAETRLPGRLAQGDLLAAPLRPHHAAAVVAIHILHLVGDLHAAVAAAAGLLRPGGRLLVSGIDGNRQSEDDMSATDRELSRRHQYPPPRADDVVAAGAGCGLRLVHDGYMPRATWEQTPIQSADNIESRAWSWLWVLDDEEWEADVVPVIAAMRALPDQDRPRPRWMEWHFLVLEAGGA